MKTSKMLLKEWFLEKTQRVASDYNVHIDFERNENHEIKVENGYATVVADVLDETEKAYKVKLWSGEVVGSCKGWTTWIPKSVCELVEEESSEKVEKKFVSVEDNGNSIEIAVFDTESEAREHAETALQYLNEREREQTDIYIADVIKDDLTDWAVNEDGEIDWACFESCGHECYEFVNKGTKSFVSC